MTKENFNLIREKCDNDSLKKIEAVKNEDCLSFLADFVKICNPKDIFVRTDSDDDAEYIRQQAVERGEEKALKIKGHTIHFDGMNDQARDKKATKYLLPDNVKLGANLNAIERKEGLQEVLEFFKNSMEGKTMIVAFFGLGPVDSEFFIPCMQITDSFYVAHSEGILYRSAYKAFIAMKNNDKFFKFIHTAGQMQNCVSKNVDKRRVYIDIKEDTVYSTNTQYAGNTVGLKKLALRLAIRKADREGWLAEHMFVNGIKGPNNRVTYFTGAFPSACGKTSTAMLQGETVIGDDIAYLRKIDNKVKAVNVECGIFGIIRDVTSDSDPVIWDVLTTEGEAIFSNILMNEQGEVFWLDDGRVSPKKGVNFSGDWYEGKLDDLGNEIPYAHKNARYTINLKRLDNCDKNLDNPEGVEVGAIVYGGRDSDTSVPVQQSFDWEHGVISMGASLESETTAATLGKEGVRTFNVMSNLDFLSIPIGKYIDNHLDFIKGVKDKPLIFGVNYFLRDENGQYLNAVRDKAAWFKWMELRVHGEVGVIKTPTGMIPHYPDLRKIFKETLNKEYTTEDYCKQFTVRIKENLAKLDRIINIYRKNVKQCSDKVFTVLEEQQKRLKDLQKEHGDYVDPLTLEAIS